MVIVRESPKKEKDTERKMILVSIDPTEYLNYGIQFRVKSLRVFGQFKTVYEIYLTITHLY